MSKTIKYKKGDSGDHASDCDCKMCMDAKDGKKDTKMSAVIAALGLGEDASADDIITALAAKAKPADDKVLLERLKKLEEADAKNIALGKKQQIDTLLADASREGKVVPYELADLYTEKDGVLTILEEPARLQKVISKLSAGQVKTPEKKVKPEAPKGSDGKTLQIFGLGKRRRENAAQLALTREFCENQRAINAPIIGRHIKRLAKDAQEHQSMN